MVHSRERERMAQNEICQRMPKSINIARAAAAQREKETNFARVRLSSGARIVPMPFEHRPKKQIVERRENPGINCNVCYYY